MGRKRWHAQGSETGVEIRRTRRQGAPSSMMRASQKKSPSDPLNSTHNLRKSFRRFHE